MRKDRILLGTTKNGEIVFGNYEVRTWNGIPEFSASFDAVRPFIPDEEDLKSNLECLIDDLDNETKLQWCDDYECCPSALADEMYDSMNYDELIDMVYDTSLYPNTIYTDDGSEWRFESVGCGQYDPRPDMDKIFDRTLFDDLMLLWDKYHLREIDESAQKLLDFMEKDADHWSDCFAVETAISGFLDRSDDDEN